MLAGPGTCHRYDAEWSLKNLFPLGLHCQTVLGAAEEKVNGTVISNISQHQIQSTMTENNRYSQANIYNTTHKHILYVLTCITNFWSIYFLAMLGWKSGDSKNRKKNS